MEKNELRTAMRKQRREMSREDINEKSRLIQDKLFSLDVFKNAQTVMVYISAFNEVDTNRIIDCLSAECKKIISPVSNTETNEIIPSYIQDTTHMHKAAYGIYEPDEIVRADISDIDLIIVPGLAFDISGMRLGFGKGYYDRLLAESTAPTVALCYDFQLFNEIPHDKHDIAVKAVITERRLIGNAL